MSDNPTPAQPTPTPVPAPANGGDQQSGQIPPSEPTWLPERLERNARSAVNNFLKDLGFEKADDLKALLTEAKNLKESQMSEVEKAQKAREKAEQRAADAEKRAAELEAARVNDRIDTAIRAAATDARAQYPEDVITWARQSGKDLAALIDKDGKLDDKGVKALIDEARKARPAWFASGGPGSPSNAGGKAPQADPAKFLEGKKFTF